MIIPTGGTNSLLIRSHQTSGFSWHFGMSVARLAEYLGYFDNWEDSCAVARQLVDTVVGLTTGQQLPDAFVDRPG